MGSPGYYEFFSEAKILSGVKALENIAVELDGFDARRPLVLLGTDDAKAGAHKKLIDALRESNVTIGALVDDVPDYASAKLCEGLGVLFRDRGCDSIIGIGGGSVIDTVKGTNIAVGAGDLLRHEGENRIEKRLKPLVVIPTIPQSGYECAGSATIDRRYFKSDYLYPDLIVIDPRTARGCCARCMAETAAVAMAHAMEVSTSGDFNLMCDVYVNASIQFLYENTAAAIKRPHNKKASMAIANASAMAGIAYSNSRPGLVQELAHALADATNHSPGVLMGIILPHELEMKLSKKAGIRPDLLLALVGPDEYSATPERERAAKAVGLVKRLQGSFAGVLPLSLKELAVPEYLLEQTARKIADSSMGFNAKECMTILRRAWDGAPAK